LVIGRSLVVALIVVATGAFIVGTAIERNTGEKHHGEQSSVASPARDGGERGAHKESGGEGHAGHAGEAGTEGGAHHAEGGGEAAGKESHEELKPLGIDIEAAPFVALAAAASLALALAAWLRPRSVLLLVAIAAAMLVFGALDVREVFHQSDESRTSLAVLAGLVAVLHVGAAAVAGVMGRQAGRSLA
jgi:hypothetical protein